MPTACGNTAAGSSGRRGPGAFTTRRPPRAATSSPPPASSASGTASVSLDRHIFCGVSSRRLECAAAFARTRAERPAQSEARNVQGEAPMRRKRWLIGTLAVLLLLIGGLFVAARLYLRSAAVAARVAREFEQTLGVPVHVGEADIGLFGGSTVRNVQVFEPKGGAWLTVDAIAADVSAFDVLRKKVRPRHGILKGLKAELRLDKEGDLLTQLPAFEGEKSQ